MRQLARIVTLPPATPGFLGAGHTAIEVLEPQDTAANDPLSSLSVVAAVACPVSALLQLTLLECFGRGI